MLLFLDTEFTDFQDCSLISIGLVSEDGSFEFYGERTDFDYEACSAFVRSNVWRHLGMFPGKKFKKQELERSLASALSCLPGPLSIAFDSDRDRRLMMEVFESSPRPTIADLVDLRPLQSSAEYVRAEAAFFSEGQPQHHALFDAKANRAGWLACGGATALSAGPAIANIELALRSEQ
jgi:hypothetical protein